MTTPKWIFVAAVSVLITLLGVETTRAQTGSLDEARLREYSGTYQWGPNAFVYLQPWSEFSGQNQLVAFDETGEVRTLYPDQPDHFFTGAEAAVPNPVQSRIEFQRDASGRITSLSWSRDGGPSRLAKRVEIEKREDVRFSNGEIHLAGTLISPTTQGPHPAVILVHASGAEDREHLLPFAHFLVRHGFAVLGYDKRGVGGSTGDWNKASFDDLAGDVVAAFEYLKSRNDIQRDQIGMLGWSQAGWIMPLAAVRAKDMAFLISVSGAGISAAETTIDEARNEMAASKMQPQIIEQIAEMMRLQYQYLRTGEGWDQYMAIRTKLATQMGGKPRPSFPLRKMILTWPLCVQLFHTNRNRLLDNCDCRCSPCSASWITTSSPKRTRLLGEPLSKQGVIQTTRCSSCQKRTTP
jgi:pimeloyl-ACP methyl ester carboxylesterase